MGLDMYLNKKTYVENEKHVITIKKDGRDHPHINPERISEITEQIAYWRKVNHIHAWFVENVQDGVDDCGEYEVSKKQLLELVKVCKTIESTAVMKNGKVNAGYIYENGEKKPILEDGEYVTNPEEVAKKLLPTQAGFFFGSTDYDQWYMDDIRRTIEQIESGLSDIDNWEVGYYYHSSW